jgi:hypothetical protein
MIAYDPTLKIGAPSFTAAPEETDASQYADMPTVGLD